MTAPVIEIRGLCTRFDDVLVHQGIDLDVAAGQILGLVGGSGSGKTTLLREIVGLLAPSAGSLKLFGQTMLDADPERGRAVRRRFGMLFQQGALFSAFSVFDNIAFPLRELRTLDEAMIRDLVLLKLAMVELEPRHGSLMPAELSGGMVKRVALARALSLEPELLVFDEPTAGLDPDLAESFVRLIKLLQRELGFTVVMVTHDLATLKGLATRLAVLADKKIIACGTAEEVLAVDHPFIHNFFGSGHSAAITGQEAS
ncbi:MAG: ATP-binding cassette domain-containing protein [Candidatus Accumulibacter sp.]|uniref:ABC transporter ATP-binding protein n=1 Tax=Accumulibacter sp. TaxID=2053492 RepID=UPI0019EB5A34|nr:ATP-binding cassette domain-containing protein [Accumulibacter sp.]MBE2258879.1 ATP-binding cassette domain-containing protein [Paracoccaceae bacterium]MCB1942819.1 ATP-binding cassette domain-containing protein [Accumulibacter sp.]MCP5249628.1 ATP-binding cassette domain-containing protein [Accumulibacter sp.]